MLYVFTALGLLFVVALIPLNIWNSRHRRSLSEDELRRQEEQQREDGRVW